MEGAPRFRRSERRHRTSSGFPAAGGSEECGVQCKVYNRFYEESAEFVPVWDTNWPDAGDPLRPFGLNDSHQL